MNKNPYQRRSHEFVLGRHELSALLAMGLETERASEMAVLHAGEVVPHARP